MCGLCKTEIVRYVETFVKLTFQLVFLLIENNAELYLVNYLFKN